MDFSINSNYANAYANYDAAAEKLSGTLSKDYANVADAELMSACKQFEAYFVEQVFKGMEKMIPKAKDENETSSLSTLKEFYQDELISNFASEATKQGEGLGIAQMLYEQMKRNIGE